MRTLAIISHTEHYKLQNGDIVGLGSTVTEINNLLEVFDVIYHVAMLHQGSATKNALPYQSEKIKLVPIPVVGGKGVTNKLSIIMQAPQTLRIISKTLRQVNYFQFRAPTGIGVYIIPYLVFFNSKKGWFKYAGNWKQNHAPLAYQFQRWLLKKQTQRPVTINGFWEDQPNQCLTFENPCLANDEVETGQRIIKEKEIENKGINFCFVGRLEKEKGLNLLLDAFKGLASNAKEKIDTLHIVGHGKALETYKIMAKDIGIHIIFHGFLSRASVHDIYKKSHAIILPSASEGFPKVIAEAINYGCLPIVSNISSIGHYIEDGGNGFLLDSITVEAIIKEIMQVLSLRNDAYSKMTNASINSLNKFTYTYYNKRIKEDILDK